MGAFWQWKWALIASQMQEKNVKFHMESSRVISKNYQSSHSYFALKGGKRKLTYIASNKPLPKEDLLKVLGNHIQILKLENAS